MRTEILLLVGCALVGVSGSVLSETYKCQASGKTVISDFPCVAGAKPVDQSSTRVTLSQQRQAEIVHQRNRIQLIELERKAAEERYARGGPLILGKNPNSSR